MLNPGWTARHHVCNGVQLHAIEAGPENGPMVVLLHGFPEFWWAWRHQIDPLTAAGFRVVALDMRGYNLSGGPDHVASYRLDILAADIIELARALGREHFCLVGHDWGGIVAWAVAVLHPGWVTRMVIANAPYPAIVRQQIARHPGQALRSAYVGFFQLPVLPEALLRAGDFALLKRALRASARPDTFPDPALAQYAQAWGRKGALRRMINYYRALVRYPPRLPERIDIPTLLVWGGRDSFLKPALAHASIALCPKGRLALLEEQTHWLHIEAHAVLTGLVIDHLRGAER